MCILIITNNKAGQLFSLPDQSERELVVNIERACCLSKEDDFFFASFSPVWSVIWLFQVLWLPLPLPHLKIIPWYNNYYTGIFEGQLTTLLSCCEPLISPWVLLNASLHYVCTCLIMTKFLMFLLFTLACYYERLSAQHVCLDICTTV